LLGDNESAFLVVVVAVVIPVALIGMLLYRKHQKRDTESEDHNHEKEDDEKRI